MDTQTLHITGMTCGGCAKHVEKALRSVAGVTSATVDLSKNTATVTGAAPLEALAASVVAAGYAVVSQP